MIKGVAYKRKQALKRRHARLRKKISGTTEKPRLAVYRSLKYIYGQIIDDVNNKTLVSVSVLEKEIFEQLKGKTKVEASKIAGEVIGERASKLGINEIVFDKGGFQYTGRVKAFADGVRSKGIKF